MTGRITFNFVQTILDEAKAGYKLLSVYDINGFPMVEMSKSGTNVDLVIRHDGRCLRAEVK